MIISFEGIEGSGKTTQINLLKKYLEDKGAEVVITSIPGGTKLGNKINKIISGTNDSNIFSKAESLMYFAACAQLYEEVIIPALDDNKIVLIEGSIYSFYAYLNDNEDIDTKMLDNLKKISIGQHKPDLILLLDIDYIEGLERKHKHKEAIHIDKKDLLSHEIIREIFLKFAQKDPRRWEVLEGAESSDLVHYKIVNIVTENLNGIFNKYW